MEAPKIPHNEAERLESLRELKILDTALEESFDEVTKLVAAICEAPIALISLVDENRQWFKSKHGIDADESPRDISFCGHAINEDKLFEISDARKDKRFSDNPFVTGESNVVFYAGTQIKTPTNLNLGTLCIIDHKPRKLNEFQRGALETLGRQVSNMLELRRNIKRIAKVEADQAAYAMAASYGHEINNPLLIAQGMLKQLERENDLSPDVVGRLKEAHMRIAHSVKRITKTLAEEGIKIDGDNVYKGMI